MSRHAVSRESPAEEAAEKGRKIQAQVDARDRESSAPKSAKGPVQAGQRDYPGRFPPQHLAKPGHEADLKQRPLFDAPS